MKLFNYKDLQVTVEPEALLLVPFAIIWKRDKTEHKLKAIAELSYIWFMQDLRSDFFAVVDEKQRSLDIVKVLDLPNGWKPDKKIKDAEIFYREVSETLSTKLLRDSRGGIEKVSELLRDPNFDKVDIKKIVDTIRVLPQLIESLKKLEDTVLKERNVIKHRGTQERSMYEDGV